MRVLRLSLLPVVALALSGALLASCSSTPSDDGGVDSDPSADTSTTSDAPEAQPACTMVSAAVIKATLGLDVQEPTQATNDSVIACTYAPTADGLTLIVRFQTDEDAASFARGRQGFDDGGQPTSDVPGLLDGAYTSSTEFGDVVTNTLVARKGSVEMLVTAATTLDAQKALVTKVLTGLG